MSANLCIRVIACSLGVRINFCVRDFHAAVKIQNTPFKYAHTALIHFNETEVKNLHGTAVTEDQIIARSLMKSFTIAAAQARCLYGVSVRCILRT